MSLPLVRPRSLAELPAAALFIDRTAGRAIDSGHVAAVLEGVQAKAADDAVGERPILHPPVQRSGNDRKQGHQRKGAERDGEHEISERQLHRQLDG